MCGSLRVRRMRARNPRSTKGLVLKLEGLANLIFLAFIITLFYFLAIRPQKRRAEAHRDLVNAVSVGDDVVTIGGMHGTVRRIEETEVELEIAPGTNVRFLKQAIARRVSDDDELDSSSEASTAAASEDPEA